MIGMQYNIVLPDDYDMGIIRSRVKANGVKTDGFQDLLFKAYLIAEKGEFSASRNEYAPLYLWKNADGMNRFIFEGFYDNILNSFGWQRINIGIVSRCSLTENFQRVNYVLGMEKEIAKTTQMKPLQLSQNFPCCEGEVIIYHPDQWRYREYYFFTEPPKPILNAKTYKILHLSM